jgi:hypothetical protein
MLNLKFRSKEELNEWAKENITNKETLAAILSPVVTEDGKPIPDDKVVYNSLVKKPMAV